MKSFIFIFLITSLLASTNIFAQTKGKKKTQDSVQIQPFPISDVILRPLPDDHTDYDTDFPDPLHRTDTATQPDEKELRIGAICADGTQSTSRGRGACAGHGGVKQWIYQGQAAPNNPMLKGKKKKYDPNTDIEALPQIELPQGIRQAPNPLTSVVEIFGQVAIGTFLFLLLFLVVKKILEKI